ncbi:HdeD family acid-resistance protein [Consotaella aegiceratis]|uniref:HdeD family acid-resistance protein n=1 Tax=Consotaella aegiceratis TaxID=3097961 RepID=UPI002F42FBEF
MSLSASPDEVATASILSRHLGAHRKFYIFQGALLAVVGFLALLAPFAATLASTIFFGWLLIVGGAIGIVSAFRARKAPGFWANLLLAVLAAILGLVMIVDPLAGSITLTWLLAVFLLLSGLFNIAVARAVRGYTTRFWLLVASGIIDIVLAMVLILGLPGTAIWAVGLFLGLSFLTSGLALLFAAIEAPKPASSL